ncbi:TPA: hypothetical protein ACWZS2_004211 [Escherichia coli]
MSSGCGDVLSLADLQTAKKHQIFEAEVITGKSGGVTGGADIDYATNPVTGQTQKTLPAVLRDAGFSPVSWDFSAGGTLTTADRDKVVYDPVSKTWYSYAGALPVTVPAGFNPVGNADWAPQTDPNLRAELSIIENIAELISKTPNPALTYTVKGYVPGTNFGGGQFYWDAAKPKSQHNGITIFSPTVPWDGSYAGLSAFLAGTGETDSSGVGCWIRAYTGTDILTSWAGHDVTGENVADVSVPAAIKLAALKGYACRADSGSVIKCGFSTGVQTHDKYNIFTQASFVLDGVNNVRFYAEKDVKIDTYHPTYLERTVFFLNNCTDVEIDGFKWNWDFTDYSISPGDTQHKQGEWWLGIVVENCGKITAKNNMVNAAEVFMKADVWNGTQYNDNVRVLDNYFKYVTNYCFISRKLNHSEFSRNEVYYNGRKWHTYGEAYAPTTHTTNIVANGNKFYHQIAKESCIALGSYVATCLIVNNVCERARGIFVEIGSASNVSVLNNYSYSTGERDSSHILLVSGGVDDEPAGGLNNLLINGNVFSGGPYSLREYHTGKPIRRGITFTNNHIVDCPAPQLVNQSYIGVIIRDNYMQVPDNFPDMAIGGQYPVIDGNTLIGVRIKARDLGYTVIGPRVTNNIFRANSIGSVFPALIDYTDFAALIAEGNNATAASYTDFIVHPLYCNNAGFRRVGHTEGFIVSPTERFGAKLTDARVGDFVANSSPTASGAYAWVCVNQSTKAFSSIALSA